MNERSTQHENDDAAQSHVDELAEQFFSQDSLHPIAMNVEDEPAHMPRGSRRAMHVTLVTLAVSAATLGAFIVYMRLIMPVPAELGSTGDAVLPGTEHSTAFATEPEHTKPAPASNRSAAFEGATDAPTAPASPAETATQPAADTTGPSSQRSLDAAIDLVATTNDAPPSSAIAETSDTARITIGHARLPVRTTASADLVGRAYAKLNRGDASGALQLAIKAVGEVPKRAEAWIALGSAYDALNDRSNARDAFRNCIARASGPYVAQCRELSDR